MTQTSFSKIRQTHKQCPFLFQVIFNCVVKPKAINKKKANAAECAYNQIEQFYSHSQHNNALGFLHCVFNHMCIDVSDDVTHGIL